VRWWCSAIVEKWTWTPRPYLGVWLLCIALAVGYAAAMRRHAARVEDGTVPDDRPDPSDERAVARERRRPWQFALGIFFLWLASDWPVGTLGASYLASIHMLQYMIYSLGAAPMMMLGTPEWMARRVLSALHLTGIHKVLAVPIVAAIASNVILIATHAPITVDTLRATQPGSFLLDMIWLVSGVILWTPIISPLPEARARTAAIKLVYLFAAAALMPMIPGGFLTFSQQPLYRTYELAPRIGVDALNDQQMAGVLMKIGNLPVIWAVMGVIWFRWYRRDADVGARTILRDPVTGAPLRTHGPKLTPAERRRAGTSSARPQSRTT
jgi:putative membrane protein